MSATKMPPKSSGKLVVDLTGEDSPGQGSRKKVPRTGDSRHQEVVVISSDEDEVVEVRGVASYDVHA